MTAPVLPPTPPPQASFRILVRDAFAADVAEWVAHGWMAPARSRRRVAKLTIQQPGLRATLLYRIAHWASIRAIPGLPMLLTQLNVALHAVELPPAVPIGPGLYMPHSVGTVINARSIGAGVTLQGGITIGLKTTPEFPEIGDRVTIGAGARVLGPIRVGDGATIGANAVVVTDIPADAVAVGVPARVGGGA